MRRFDPTARHAILLCQQIEKQPARAADVIQTFLPHYQGDVVPLLGIVVFFSWPSGEGEARSRCAPVDSQQLLREFGAALGYQVPGHGTGEPALECTRQFQALLSAIHRQPGEWDGGQQRWQHLQTDEEEWSLLSVDALLFYMKKYTSSMAADSETRVSVLQSLAALSCNRVLEGFFWLCVQWPRVTLAATELLTALFAQSLASSAPGSSVVSPSAALYALVRVAQERVEPSSPAAVWLRRQQDDPTLPRASARGPVLGVAFPMPAITPTRCSHAARYAGHIAERWPAAGKRIQVHKVVGCCMLFTADGKLLNEKEEERWGRDLELAVVDAIPQTPLCVLEGFVVKSSHLTLYDVLLHSDVEKISTLSLAQRRSALAAMVKERLGVKLSEARLVERESDVTTWLEEVQSTGDSGLLLRNPTSSYIDGLKSQYWVKVIDRPSTPPTPHASAPASPGHAARRDDSLLPSTLIGFQVNVKVCSTDVFTAISQSIAAGEQCVMVLHCVAAERKWGKRGVMRRLEEALGSGIARHFNQHRRRVGTSTFFTAKARGGGTVVVASMAVLQLDAFHFVHLYAEALPMSLDECERKAVELGVSKCLLVQPLGMNLESAVRQWAAERSSSPRPHQQPPGSGGASPSLLMSLFSSSAPPSLQRESNVSFSGPTRRDEQRSGEGRSEEEEDDDDEEDEEEEDQDEVREGTPPTEPDDDISVTDLSLPLQGVLLSLWVTPSTCPADAESGEESTLAHKVTALGGGFVGRWSVESGSPPPLCTHIVSSETPSPAVARTYPQLFIQPQWVEDCYQAFARLPEAPYHPQCLDVLRGYCVLVDTSCPSQCLLLSRLARRLGAAVHVKWRLVGERSHYCVADTRSAVVEEVWGLGGLVVTSHWLLDCAIAHAVLPPEPYVLPL